jgi:hypothetical protein
VPSVRAGGLHHRAAAAAGRPGLRATPERPARALRDADAVHPDAPTVAWRARHPVGSITILWSITCGVHEPAYGSHESNEGASYGLRAAYGRFMAQ